MHLRMPRGMKSACVISALAVGALAAPGVASATPEGEQCSGASIEGRGASLQKLAQISIWTVGFNKSANAAACNGTQGSKATPTVKYTSEGSGPGLENWGVERVKNPLRFGAEAAYIASDEPVNAKQKEEIESHKGGKLQTIPVLQAAVTISMHLPEHCTVTGGPEPGRIALKESVAEKIFRGYEGGVKEWKQILNGAKFVENKEAGKECNAKAAGAALIKRVVRKEGSGTTSLFKKFLNIVYGKPLVAAENKTWKELAESAHNTTWPDESGDAVIRGEGNGGMAEQINANAGSIGYVNLADARSKGFATPKHGGGSGTNEFWAVVQNKTAAPITYSDPATNGDVEAAQQSNCANTLYTNGKKKFPPPSTEELWNEVTSNKAEPNYVICGFTYDFSLTHFSGITEGTTLPTKETVLTAYNYLTFLTSAGLEGGQEEISNNTDYLGLPSPEGAGNVLKIAQEGVARINY